MELVVIWVVARHDAADVSPFQFGEKQRGVAVLVNDGFLRSINALRLNTRGTQARSF